MRRFAMVVLSLFLGVTMISSGWAKVGVDELKKSMAQLDRAYIPALAITGENNREKSEKAMDFLKIEWNSFKSTYYDYPADDRLWKTDLTHIGFIINEADQIVRGGRRLGEAHEKLEKVRLIMKGIRARQHMDYYPDLLTEFHEPMENIVLVVMDQTKEKLTETEISRLKNNLPRAKRLWDQVSAASPNSKLFDLTPEKVQQINGLVKAESEALLRLEEALKGQDKVAIITAAVGIKPSYAKTYMAFGDFDRLK